MAPKRKIATTAKSARARAGRSTSKESTGPQSPSKPVISQRKSSRNTRATSGEPAAGGRSLRGRSASEEPKNELFGLDDPEKALKAARRKRNGVSETPSRGTTPDVVVAVVEPEIIPIAYPAVNNDYNPHELSTIREESTIELATPQRRHHNRISSDTTLLLPSIEDKFEEDVHMEADPGEQLQEELFEEIQHEMMQKKSPEIRVETPEIQVQDDKKMAQHASPELTDDEQQKYATPSMYEGISYYPSDTRSDSVSPNFHQLAVNNEIAVSTPAPEKVRDGPGIKIEMPPLLPSPKNKNNRLAFKRRHFYQPAMTSPEYKPFNLSPAPVDPYGLHQNWYHKDGWGRYQPVPQLGPKAWLNVKEAELAFSYPAYQKRLNLLNHSLFHMVNTQLEIDTSEPLLPQLIHLQGLLDYVSHDPAVSPTAGYAAQAKFFAHKLVNQVTVMEQETKAREEEKKAREEQKRKEDLLRDDETKTMEEAKAMEEVKATDEVNATKEVKSQAESKSPATASSQGQDQVIPVTPTNSVFVNKSQTEVKQPGWLSSFVSPFKFFGSRTQPVKKIIEHIPSLSPSIPSESSTAPAKKARKRQEKQHDPLREGPQPLEPLQDVEDTMHAEMYTERGEKADEQAAAHKEKLWWKDRRNKTYKNPFTEPDYATIAWTFGNKRKLASDLERIKEFDAMLAQNLRAPYNEEELHFIQVTKKKEEALKAHQARLKAGRGSKQQPVFVPEQVAGKKRSSPHHDVDADEDIENQDPERSTKRVRRSPAQDGSPTPKAKGKRLSRSPSARTLAIGYTSPVPGDPEFRHVNEDLTTTKATHTPAHFAKARATGSAQPSRNFGMTFTAPDAEDEEMDLSPVSGNSVAKLAARRLEQERSERAQPKKIEMGGIIKRHLIGGGTTFGLDDAFFESDSDEDSELEMTQNNLFESTPLSSTPGPGSKRKYTEAELEAKAEELERREAALRELEVEISNKRQRLNDDARSPHTPQWTQAPPPAPTPSHAQLPNGASPAKSSTKSTPNGFSAIYEQGDTTPLQEGAKVRMEELIAKQKAQANKFAPKKPSGLREASRYSSPATSDVGAVPPPPVQPEHPAGGICSQDHGAASSPLGRAVTGGGAEITPPASPTETDTALGTKPIVGFGVDEKYRPIPIKSVFGPGVIPEDIDLSGVMAAMHKAWDPLLRHWDEVHL